MQSFKKRVAQLEIGKRRSNLKSMTRAELDAHVATFTTASPEFYAAVMLRGGTPLPVVKDDPDYKRGQYAVR